MIPKVGHGSEPVGLVRYLLGPGKVNEHTNPHMVAGDDRLMLGYGGRELTVRGDANPLGHAIDYARAQHDTQPSDGQTVWHTSLSLRGDEGTLSDVQWQQISNRFMQLMGFTGDDGQAPVRWAAIRHGLSAKGNDHVHLVASRSRDDGTLASWHYDKRRSQQVARQVEQEFGLQQLGTDGQGMPGYSQTEARRFSQQRQPGRIHLEPAARAAAEAAGSEADFVRHLREHGVLVRPRYAAGGTSQVVGYSVAAPPTAAARAAGQTGPVWFGGGRLARDLTLPQLRSRWDDTAAQRLAAVGEWRRQAERHGRIENKKVVTREDWRDLDDEVSALNQWIGSLAVDDVEGWRHAAGQAAGGFATLARRLEASGTGPVNDTARALARCAQTPRGQEPATPRAAPRLRATNTLLLQAGTGRGSMAGWMAVLRQLERTSRAVARARTLGAEARHAQSRADDALARVATFRATRETTPTAPAAGKYGTSKRLRQQPHRGGRPKGPERGSGPRR